MSFFDKFGGMANLAKLATNPEMLAPYLVKVAPVSLHTLGRQRMYSEIAMMASMLARNAHTMLASALVQKRELTAEEGNSFAAMELQLLQLASSLNDFRKVPAGEFTIDHLRAAFGFPPPNGPAAQAAGNEGNPPKSNGHAGPA